MREIKFRAWNIAEKVMVDEIYPGDLGWVLVRPESCISMQYTGLKDRHGKEIYEGDILSVTPSIGDVVRATVAFEGGRFYLVSSKDTEYNLALYQEEGYYPCFNWSDCEVIGNIHENPDLLK